MKIGRLDSVVTIATIVVISFLLGFIGAWIPLDFLFSLTAGWAIFVWRVVPQVTVDWTSIATAAVALVLFAFGVGRLGRWILGEQTTPDGKSRVNWRSKWTLMSVLAVLAMFASGIAVVGIVHQLGWLITAKQALTQSDRGARHRVKSRLQLGVQTAAAREYHDEHDMFPPGGTFDSTGTAMHGWQTYLLPGIDQAALFERIDFDRTWNDSQNAPVFQTSVDRFLNPGIQREHRAGTEISSDGLALSHYAANGWLFSANSQLTIEQITDGASHTLFAGEVNRRFKPWGDPTNWRDPALGLNRSSYGFGSPYQGGAQFAWADGSVQFLSDSIDPDVLKAISTPSGGEPTGEF